MYQSSTSFKDHIDRVSEFMAAANQTVRPSPGQPTPKEVELRAKLIMEEALETVEALGVSISFDGSNLCGDCLQYMQTSPYDPKGVLDGVCDIFVVTTGTAACCGLGDVLPEALERVDENNLSKVDGAHWFRDDGKLMKSPNYVPVNLDNLIKTEG